MDLLYILVIGALSGWLAGLLVSGSSGGLLQDIIVGIAGAFIGGWLLAKLGVSLRIGSATINLMVTSVIGAVVLLFVAGLFRKR
jgi:uncharacterized membrane protein YeaQ/YmgE (transglycosylase-associated protein family)